MLDPTPYLAVPYLDNGRSTEGADCWGLVRLVYRRERGIELPAWDTVDAADPAARAVAMVEETAAGWLAIEPGRERPLDVILFNEAGRPCHCGVVLVPGKEFLHTRAGSGPRVSPYHRLDRREQWWRRLVAFHRHPALA